MDRTVMLIEERLREIRGLQADIRNLSEAAEVSKGKIEQRIERILAEVRRGKKQT